MRLFNNIFIKIGRSHFFAPRFCITYQQVYVKRAKQGNVILGEDFCSKRIFVWERFDCEAALILCQISTKITDKIVIISF